MNLRFYKHKYYVIGISGIFFLYNFLVTPVLSLAQTTSSSEAPSNVYQSFTNFPGIGRISSLCGLITILWQLGFVILILGSFSSFVYAGYKYLTSGVHAGKVNEAKEIIISAITGLILGSASFIILNTINPDLLNARCNLPSAGISVTGGPGPSTVGPTGQSSSCAVIGGPIDTKKWRSQQGGSYIQDQLPKLEPALRQVITCIFDKVPGQYNKTNDDFAISSLTSGTHSAGSAHYVGCAVDIAHGPDPHFLTGPTGKAIVAAAKACGINPKDINPGSDCELDKHFHIHVDIGANCKAHSYNRSNVCQYVGGCSGT